MEGKIELNKAIQFYPSKGLGIIEFSFDEDDIINALGQPDEIDEDTISDTESVVSLSYYDLGLDFFIEYLEDDRILSIHSDDIIIEGEHLVYMEKDKMVDLLKSYHDKNNLEFQYEKFYEDDSEEEVHYFDSIGLTIWYIDDSITDICVQDPDDM